MIRGSASLRSEIWVSFCRGKHSKSLIFSLKVLFELGFEQFLNRIIGCENPLVPKVVSLGRLSWFVHDGVFERFTVRIATPISESLKAISVINPCQFGHSILISWLEHFEHLFCLE